MPYMPCDKKPVLCIDSPITNTSSEAVDQVVYLHTNYGDPENPPPLGTDCDRSGLMTVGTSLESQDKAEINAYNDLQMKLDEPCPDNTDPDEPDNPVDPPVPPVTPPVPPDNPPSPPPQLPENPDDSPVVPPVNPPDEPTDPNIPPPPQLYGNFAQSCSFDCGDGLLFTYTVPQGTFVGTDQVQVNQVAYSYACQQASAQRICLFALPVDAVCVDQSGSVLITAYSANTPLVMSIVSGSVPTGMVFAQASGFTATVSGTPTTIGDYSFTVRAVDTLGNYSQRTYTVHVGGITTTSPLPVHRTGQNVSQTITYSGSTFGTRHWNAGGLPEGLSMSPSGVISGIPTLQGTFTINVSTFDDYPNGPVCSKDFEITIYDCVDEGLLNSTANVWDVFSVTISTHAPTQFDQIWFVTSGSLPPGLYFVDDAGMTAEIGGRPTTAGVYNFTLTVDGLDWSCSSNQTITILGLDCINESSLPDGTVGTAYSQALTTGRTLLGPTVWSISAGALPDGLSIDAGTGAITGTPTVAGDFDFDVHITDAGLSCARDFVVHINPKPACIICGSYSLCNSVYNMDVGDVMNIQNSDYAILNNYITYTDIPTNRHFTLCTQTYLIDDPVGSAFPTHRLT